MEPSYNRYTARHRRRWPYLVAAVVCVLAALAAWQSIGVPRVSAVTPGPDAYVKDAAQTIVLDVHGLDHLSDVRVTFDGDDVTSWVHRQGDRVSLAPGRLDDGPHTVSFSAASSNFFRHTIRKEWCFTVDTRVPTLRLDADAAEGRINTSPSTFNGTTEPFSTVTIACGKLLASGQADAKGEYAVSIRLPDGPSDVTITTQDRAGNSTAKRLHVFVDAEPPTLKVAQLGKIVKHAGLKLRISARDQLGSPQLRATLDDHQVALSGTASHALLRVSNQAQGRHVLVVSATDRGGNVVTDKQTFVVDSTEHFGAAVLWPGARGADVRVLQQHLIDAGVYSGTKSGVYDKRTVAAVEAFQQRYGLEADGIVGGSMLNALSGRIVVDLSELRLYLYRDEHLVKWYHVATGQPDYPTPTGTYCIVEKVKDPTWLPPNSDWAKTAKPIKPGTENPLGTRWMGTSAPGVGIHGIPPSEDSSIGTYASHGCVRMHNWDAVDLFDRVSVGMPVIIRP